MSGADDYVRYNDYLSRGDLLEGVSTAPEFWSCYEILRGIDVEEKHNFFSCSC